MKVNKLISNLKNVIILILIMFLTYFFIFSKVNMNDIWHIIINSNHIFIITAIISMFFFFVMEALNIKMLFRNMDTKISILSSIKYSLIGFFFSGITPAATGGQPVEIYYMAKEGIPGYQSSLVLVIQLLSYKIAALSLALIGFYLNYAYLTTLSKLLFLCGFIVYLFPLTLLIMCIFKPSFVKKLVSIVINFLKKIGIKKGLDNQEKINNAINQYNESSMLIRKNRFILIKSILLSFGGITCCYLVSYLVFKALGYMDLNIMTIFWRQSMLYAMASWFPLPGAVGASEMTYLNLFGFINNHDILVSGLLLYRGITFYFYIIVGLIIYLITFLKNLNK